MTRRPRQITRRISGFPHIGTRMALDPARPTAFFYPVPIMSFKSMEPSPGYFSWKRLYKKRRKAGG